MSGRSVWLIVLVMATVARGKRDLGSANSLLPTQARLSHITVGDTAPGGRGLLSDAAEDPVWQYFALFEGQFLLGPDIVASIPSASAAECASRCLEDESCEFFAWCPADTRRGCGLLGFGAQSGSNLSQPETCLLSFDGVSNRTAYLAMNGAAVQWISGFWCENCTEASMPGERMDSQPKQSPSADGSPAPPELPPSPLTPPSKNGSCAQMPNKLLYYSSSPVTSNRYNLATDTADECCMQCRNWPPCRFWNYCPATEENECLTKLRSYEIKNTPGSCNLFPLEKDGKAEVEEEGKGWVSGYDLEKGSVPTPSKMPGASWCTQVPNTLLVPQGSSNNLISTMLETAEDCCTLCQSLPLCSLWYYCPKTEADGCFTTLASYEVKNKVGSCNVQYLEKGVEVVADQTGATVKWISGYVVEKVPKPSPSIMPNTKACTQVSNTLLYYGYAKYKLAVSSVEECCLRCRNSPFCELWSYCPPSETDGCFTTKDGYMDSTAGGCSLYGPLETGEKASIDVTGPAVPWISGYVVEIVPMPSPSPPTAGSCSPITNTLVYNGYPFEKIATTSLDECCLRCQNTPSCSLWSHCPSTEKNGCFAISDYHASEPGSCNFYSMEKGDKASVDQTGPETNWVSGFDLEKVPTPSSIPASGPGSCTQVPNTLLFFTDSHQAVVDVKSADECCSLCAERIDCKLWNYCPIETADSNGCYTLQENYRVGFIAGSCNLYVMKIGEKPYLDQRGPETPWISGYRPE